MTECVITGGSGFLGKYLLKLLQSKNIETLVLDDLDPLCGGAYEVPRLNVDVRNYTALKDAILDSGAITVFHLAAYGRNLSCQHFPLEAWNVNVNGTLNVLEIARRYKQIQRVVCCSSNITLSDQPTVYKDTKLAVEALVKLYSTMGVSCMGIRPSNIYGEGQSKTEYQPCAFAGLDTSYTEQKHFKITGDGTQARDWVHAKDVARAFCLAGASDATGITVDVCTGELTDMNTIASLLKVPVVYVPARPGDAKVLISDPQPAKDLLDFSAEVRLQDAIWDAFPGIER